jgi:tRNA threonylcarbamoyladenosine biosynthesis protein TsaB
MTRLLSIDSSTPHGNVALSQNQSIIRQAFQSDASYSDGLLRLVDTVLGDCELSLERLDGFVVTTGPGSFTGLRVGLSLVKGFVLATEKPFVGIGTLEAVAAQHPPTSKPICAVLDARKKEVYYALFRYADGGLARLTADQVVAPERLCESIDESTHFIGPGTLVYGQLFASLLGNRYRPTATDAGKTPAGAAALLAEKRFATEKSFDLNSLNVNYVRKSEAEIRFNR